MEDDERIAFGLATIEMLASQGERWDAFVRRHGERTLDVLLFQLDALVEAIPDDTSSRASYRGRLMRLIASVRVHHSTWRAIPSEVADAARACRGPVPLSWTGTPATAPDAPVREGVRSKRERAMVRVQRAMEELGEVNGIVAASALDREGRLVGFAGSADALDELPRVPSSTLGATGDAARGFFRERGVTMRLPEPSQDHAHVRVLADRLILVVAFGAATSVGLVLLHVKRIAASLDDVLGAFPEIGDDDLDNLLR